MAKFIQFGNSGIRSRERGALFSMISVPVNFGAIILLTFLTACNHFRQSIRAAFDEPFTVECGAGMDDLFHVSMRIEDLDKSIRIISAERRLSGGYVANIPVENYVCRYMEQALETICREKDQAPASRFEFSLVGKNLRGSTRKMEVSLPNFPSATGRTTITCKNSE